MSGNTGINLGRAMVGGIIVLFGLLFLLDQLDLVDSDAIWRYWPLLLVAFGLLRLVSGGGSRVGGTIIILVGLFLFFDWWEFWPLLLIVVGLSVLWSGLGRSRGFSSGPRRATAEDLREFVVFGGSERRITATGFRGGDVTTIFGSFEVDLREATLAPEGAALDVATIFGGVEIRVPEGWEITQAASVLLGGYEDHTKPPAGAPPVPAGTRPRLTIRGLVLFGGVEVRN